VKGGVVAIIGEKRGFSGAGLFRIIIAELSERKE
jgi:hypothetical protein